MPGSGGFYEVWPSLIITTTLEVDIFNVNSFLFLVNCGKKQNLPS